MTRGGPSAKASKEMGTLVVVEDEPIFRRSIERAVRHADAKYRCEMCASFAQAMAFLARVDSGDRSLAGFLVDVDLGDGSGLEVLARARTLFPDVPAVVMTGKTDTETEAEALNAAWVRKGDLNLNELLRDLEAQRSRPALWIHDAVTSLARAADLRVLEVRIVASVAAGATSENLHECLGITEAACKSRLGRMGRRTGLGGVEPIRTALLRIQHRGAAAFDELSSHGLKLRTLPDAASEP